MPSAAIRHIGYDEASQSLFVTFQSGERYAYLGVSRQVCGRFMLAESRGRFFQTEIRDRYRYRKLGPGDDGAAEAAETPPNGPRPSGGASFSLARPSLSETRRTRPAVVRPPVD